MKKKKVLNPSKFFLALKKDNPRILSTFKRPFSKRAGKASSSNIIHSLGGEYLTILPRARMGFESIAHEEEGRMGYWLRGHEGERNNCFSKIQLLLVKNIETKQLKLAKCDLAAIVLVFKAGAFRYYWAVKGFSRRLWPYRGPTAMPCWWAPIRAKQLCMAATAGVIWLCVCVRHWPYRGVV